ncbi:MBL fold metallo-hydrolase [Rosistilla oblonga]|uniref:Metallo-beta-lactamase superfamily protein n=1 Tax=Rosistilla oblonga TaxID=2527990 RepID=A0A518IUM7_9BACT|nr:MBL fold metallo-hydrolase [Rosistilla oblonga]QDV56796.1 Metallo-beta-lactamase superfamily protein [Rosistilla oblonga]
MPTSDEAVKLQHDADAAPSAAEAVRAIDGIAPATGTARRVAEGVWWIRLPVAAGPGHVNVYALQDRDGIMLVDTGTNTPQTLQTLTEALRVLQSSCGTVRRVVVTHHHPDHIGLAGWFAEQGAEIVATPGTLAVARRMLHDKTLLRTPEEIGFAVLAGMKDLELAAFIRRPKRQYADAVAMLPDAINVISDGETLQIGRRCWRAIVGNGHAVDHLTLCSNDGLVISGDQILPGMSTNLNVPTDQPDLDPIAAWRDTCRRIGEHIDDRSICLPGHHTPFTGIAIRSRQMIASHEAVASRLLGHLQRPRTAIDCLAAIYRRTLSLAERAFLFSEAVGYMNHLANRGEIVGLRRGKTIVWQKQRRPRGDTIRRDVSPAISRPNNFSSEVDETR